MAHQHESVTIDAEYDLSDEAQQAAIRRLENRIDRVKMIEIKQDIDAFVVYIDGKIHPKGTGFSTRKDAIDWCIKEGIWK